MEVYNPKTKMRFQVAVNDFEDQMKWEDAKNACIELGNGWRLPTIEELILIREELYSEGKGNLKNTTYWSSTEYDLNNAMYISFYWNQVNHVMIHNVGNVRAVRTI